MPDDQTVTTSDRLWSEEVEIAKGGQEEDKTAYEWSNGKKFEDGDGPYATPA